MAKKQERERLSARYLDDDLVLSDTHAWTWARLPLVPYEFRSDGDREGILNTISLALAGLVIGLNEVDCHLRITNRPLNVDAWADDLNERVLRNNPPPGWEAFLEGQRQHLAASDYPQKETYVGICLGSRSSASKNAGPNSNGGVLGMLNSFADMIPTKKIEKALEYEDDVVSQAELDKWRKKAADVQRRLANSKMRAQPAHPAAIAALLKQPWWPGMTAPPVSVSPNRVWGPGEIEALIEGFVTNGHKYLRIDQVDEYGRERSGYTATLALSRFPESLLFPAQEPWLHMAAQLAFPVEISSRFKIIPSQKVKTEVERKLLEAKDMGAHTAGATGGVPLALQEQMALAENLEFTLTKDNTPFAYGRHRITVSADDPEELLARCRAVADLYRDLSIDVQHPTGDQLSLLLEQMPGDKVRLNSYYQRHELALIGGGMPTASAQVGDHIEDGRGWIGAYIGETTSRARTNVHFTPHVAPTRNRPPGIAIIGAPGGGKSFLAFTLAYQMAMYGAWVIYIDPKADAKPLGMVQGLGKSNVFDLREGHAGMLDPYSLGQSTAEATLMAMDSLRLLLGGELSEGREVALLAAIEAVGKAPDPSLSKVVDHLESQAGDAAAQALAGILRMMRELPFARLCFDPSGGHRIRPEDGLTVITLLGLDLPTAATASKDYTYGNRLAVTVMYLLTMYARQLMLNADKGHPKAICIDEAWAITSTPQGAKLVPEIARMGRSHNCVLVLVSQNAQDLMDDQVTNSISTIFAFRASGQTEIDSVLTLLGMDNHQGHHETISGLNNGECVMRDMDGRLQLVQVVAYDEDLFNVFNTNPETRGKHESAIPDETEWSDDDSVEYLEVG